MDFNIISDFYAKVESGYSRNKETEDEINAFLKDLIFFCSTKKTGLYDYTSELKKIKFNPNLPYFPEMKSQAVKESWEKGIADFLIITKKLLMEFSHHLTNDDSETIEYVIKSSTESLTLEFKSTLRWDLKEKCVNKELEKVVLKTVCAFSNSEGGHLFIGVSDDNSILGLTDDYQTLEKGKGNRDKFELHLRNLLNQEFTLTYVLSNVKISFPIIGSAEICHVQVNKGTKPMFLLQADKQGQKKEKFYVRSGNQSKEVESASEILGYALTRFQ